MTGEIKKKKKDLPVVMYFKAKVQRSGPVHVGTWC